MRPPLLDPYCGAGGAATGYYRAGFQPVGVDIRPQPRYPFEFIQADALEFMSAPGALARFAAVAGSPICQGHARVTAWRGRPEEYPDLLTPTIALLSAQDLPWVVENVPEAPIRPDWLLCGTQFGLLVKRHRAFQAGNWQPAYELMPPCQCYRNPRLLPFMHKNERAYADAMGCTWMTNKEARQAIPPAYTEHIGRQLLAEMTVTA